MLPNDYEKAFKDADIRGIYPTEINEDVAYRTARAFVEQFNLKQVVVGRDMRLSSPALRDAFVRGAAESGANVIDLGLIATPMMYYASGTMESFGVMITASHNPKEYNGLKLVKTGAVPLTNTSGLRDIQDRVIANTFTNADTPGSVEMRDIQEEYRKYIQSQANITTPRPIRIVVDAGNGMATLLAPLLCCGLPVETTELFFELDGMFPNRDSNPTLAQNQQAIVSELQSGDYDFGIAFDGDADRVAFFDENGNYINSATIGALLTKHFLQETPGESFVYTVFTSKIYEDTINQYGGNAIRARVGHAFIKELMREHNARFGCEHSAHFYFRGNFFADSGILTLLFLLASYADVMSEEKKFSDLLSEFMLYHQTEEILVEVADKTTTLQAVRDHYAALAPTDIEEFDGVTIRFPDYWFVVKPSVTEDALKFVVESADRELAEVKKQEVLEFLQSQK